MCIQVQLIHVSFRTRLCRCEPECGSARTKSVVIIVDLFEARSKMRNHDGMDTLVYLVSVQGLKLQVPDYHV